MSTFSLFSQPANIEPTTPSNLSADTSDLVSHSPILSLFELNNMVRDTLECSMPDSYWVQAEISEAREVRGHCYMELIEKMKALLLLLLVPRQNAGVLNGNA